MTDEIVPCASQPPTPVQPKFLSRDERIAAYIEGLTQTTETLRALGFVVLACAEHTVSTQFKDYLFDFRNHRPELVAHVSGKQLPGGRKGAHGGTIYLLSDEIKNEFC